MNKTRRRKARARRAERQGKLVGAAYLAEREAHRQACHIEWVNLTGEMLAEHERLHLEARHVLNKPRDGYILNIPGGKR